MLCVTCYTGSGEFRSCVIDSEKGASLQPRDGPNQMYFAVCTNCIYDDTRRSGVFIKVAVLCHQLNRLEFFEFSQPYAYRLSALFECTNNHNGNRVYHP